VALARSLAEQSTSLLAARIALEGAAEAGADTALFDIRERDLPAWHFASGRITTPEAGRAEAALQPVSDAEVRRAP
jgi:hypothetical protein